MATTSTRLTLEQYAELPEEPFKQELLDGELYNSDSSFRCHSFSQEVGRALMQILPAEFDVYFHLSMRFPNTKYATVLRPDLSVFRTDDLPKMHEVEEDSFIVLHPLLICEGIYPDQDEEFLHKKIDVYRSWGVPWVWSLDIERRGVVTEGPSGKRWQENEICLEAPFPPLRLDLKRMFNKMGMA